MTKKIDNTYCLICRYRCGHGRDSWVMLGLIVLALIVSAVNFILGGLR